MTVGAGPIEELLSVRRAESDHTCGRRIGVRAPIGHQLSDRRQHEEPNGHPQDDPAPCHGGERAEGG